MDCHVIFTRRIGKSMELHRGGVLGGKSDGMRTILSVKKYCSVHVLVQGLNVRYTRPAVRLPVSVGIRLLADVIAGPMFITLSA